MRNYYRIPIMFYEAATFIRFVKENAAALGREKILGIYPTEMVSWRETTPGRKIFDTSSPLIIEFESFVMQISSFFYSEMTIVIVSRDDFCKGELTRHLLGAKQLEEDPQPFEKEEFFQQLDSPIVEVIVERFSHSFEMEPSRGSLRLDGGDYFASVYFMLKDKGLRICAQDAESDGYMDFELVDWIDVDRLQDNPKYIYEHIRL